MGKIVGPKRLRYREVLLYKYVGTYFYIKSYFVCIDYAMVINRLFKDANALYKYNTIDYRV